MNPLTFLAYSDISVYRDRYDRHVVGYGTIQLTSGAELEVSYDGYIHQISAEPTFWPAYPGPRLRFHAKDRASCWHHRHLAFNGPRLNEWKSLGLWPFLPTVVPSDHWIETFEEIQKRSADRNGTVWAMNRIEALLIELQPQATHHKQPDWLEQVIVLLRNPDSKSYQQIAEEVGMGESTLRRKFQEHIGIPIHRFSIDYRLGEVRRWLVETNAPLRVIAEELGYPNEFYLARQFKKWTGVTPGTYRRSR
jgi:AraC-like DNA-binding protein